MICMKMYFEPIHCYIKKSFELASNNNGALFYSSTVLTATIELIRSILDINFFGIPNYLLFLVVLTVLLDAYYGIKKSLKESKRALEESKKYDEGSPNNKKYLKIYELKKFKSSRLQFTFFKCFTLLGYLYFVKNLMLIDSDGFMGEILGFTSNLTLKIPVAIFWYYDFKSIGDNSAYVYGKKAPIFTIVENILEFKIKNYLNNKS